MTTSFFGRSACPGWKLSLTMENGQCQTLLTFVSGYRLQRYSCDAGSKLRNVVDGDYTRGLDCDVFSPVTV